MLRRIIYIFSIFFLPVAAHAQFIFQNIRWQDGLSAKEIRCMYKDASGFLWIGTSNGLNRFDGAVVRQYKNTEHLNSIYVNAIYPFAGTDSLLIGTKQGIRLFNKKAGTFTTDKRFELLKDEVVGVIEADDQGRIWMGTNGKLFVYADGKAQPASAIIPAAKNIGYQSFNLGAFTWDKSRNGFWVGGSVTYFLDCKRNDLYDTAHNPLNYPLLDKRETYAIALDSKNNIWYGSNENLSLNFWNSRTNTTDTYLELDGIKLTGGVNRIFIDHKDRIWISTWLFASFLKEPEKPIKKIPYSQSQTYSIGYGFFRDAIEDPEGNVWLGTINGVSKSQAKDPLEAIYQLPSFEFFLQTGFAHINHVSIDKDIIVASKEEGVVMYNTTERTYKRYMVTSNPEELLRNRLVMSAKSGNKWWFAGEDGIYSLENGSSSLVKFNQVKPGNIKSSNFVFADSSGNIWFQIVHDAIYRYNPNTNKCDRFDGTDSTHGKFKYGTCKTALVLRNKDVLFTMGGAGILKFDVKTEQFTVIPVATPREFNVSQLQEDKKGILWAAVANKGIYKMDLTGKFLDSINTSNGLLYDNITNLAIDNRGIIWAASREGMMFFDPEIKAVTKVEIDLGQTLQDYWNNITFQNGKIYAVMLDHVVVIDPLLYSAVQVKTPPHITSIKIFGEEITQQSEEGTIQLSPNEDFVTFQFASLNHREILSLQYSYQLEGVDKDWVNCGRALSVSYNNLPPGNYTFKVRSTDEHGKWMSSITSVKLHVKPHWWQTWWFLSLCAIAALLLLLAAYRNNRNRKEKKNIDRTIDYFANSVYGENSVNEICWDIARNCISQLNFEDCVVYLHDEKRNVFVQKAAYGEKNPKGHEIIDPMEIPSGKGIVGTVGATGKPLLVADTEKDSRYLIDDAKRNSELAVPILHDGKVIGVIDSEHSQKNFFTENHVKALSTIASISSNKIAEANAEMQAKENEVQLLEIRKLLAESQLMALRAQMNPHFVFNCLNSIQECIVTHKYGEASKYLNKFSKLFRSVLNNSDKKLVTLSEEKEVLQLYLELEAMRFENSFEYKITIDDDMEMDEVLVPSMLLQPFVENALWHGLMHKQGNREMFIHFHQVNDEVFQCIIDDNGIGRKMSAELKVAQSKTKRHESKGMRISQDRVDLLQRQGQHASMRIIDKYDDAGNATGTTVIIELSTFLT